MKNHVFDLDNTLIYTDSLNNESYNSALRKFGLNEITVSNRITRDLVFNVYPKISAKKKKNIIELKQKYFLQNLTATIPNTSLINFLKTIKVEQCILWTRAEKSRVLALLEFYEIEHAFKQILHSSKANLIKDVQIICEIFGCKPEHLVFYEDNPSVINSLKLLNIEVKSTY